MHNPKIQTHKNTDIGKEYIQNEYTVKSYHIAQGVCVCVSVCVCGYVFSCLRLFVNPCSVACQIPLSMEFSSQEYWSGLPFSTSGDILYSGTETDSLMSPMFPGRFFTTEPLWKPISQGTICSILASPIMEKNIRKDVYMCITELLCCTAEINIVNKLCKSTIFL